MTFLPECNREYLAIQIEALAAGDDKISDALARHFGPGGDGTWIARYRKDFKKLLEREPDLQATAMSIAKAWLGVRASEAKPPADHNVALEHGLLEHFMERLNVKRAFLGLISPLSNQFKIAVSIPEFPEDPLGRDATDKSLVGLVANWKCPYVAPDIESSMKDLDGWWRPTPKWGHAGSVLCLPLLVLNDWPDGTPFPYPIGSLYFEHDDREHFGPKQLVLMTLVASIVAPWLLSYRRALGLAHFNATARFARNDPPRVWPATLTRELGSALNELRSANCAFVLHSGIPDQAGEYASERQPTIDALVGIDHLRDATERDIPRLREIFRLGREQPRTGRGDDDVLAQCRLLANSLELARRDGTTRAAREMVIAETSHDDASIVCRREWDCSRGDDANNPFMNGVVSTVVVATRLSSGPNKEPLVVSLTAECSAIRFTESGTLAPLTDLSLDGLRAVGAQGWLREPYFFRFEEVQYLNVVASKLSEFVWRRWVSSRSDRTTLSDFVPLTVEVSKKVDLAVKLAQSFLQESGRMPVVLVRGDASAGKSSLARAIHRDKRLLGNDTEPIALDLHPWSRVVLEQSCRRSLQELDARASVVLMDDADRMESDAVATLHRLLTTSTPLPGAILVLTYRSKEQQLGQRPSREAGALDLIASMQALDGDAALREKLAGALDAAPLHVVDLPSYDQLSVDDRREVVRLCVELEKEQYAQQWNAKRPGSADVLVEGPDELAVSALLDESEPTDGFASLRRCVRMWIYLSEIRQFDRDFDPRVDKVRIAGKDLGTARRVARGGSIYFREDFEAALQELEAQLLASCKRHNVNKETTEALLDILRALAALHHECPQQRYFDRKRIEHRRGSDHARNALQHAFRHVPESESVADPERIIERLGKTNSAKYGLSARALDALGLHVDGNSDGADARA